MIKLPNSRCGTPSCRITARTSAQYPPQPEHIRISYGSTQSWWRLIFYRGFMNSKGKWPKKNGTTVTVTATEVAPDYSGYEKK